MTEDPQLERDRRKAEIEQMLKPLRTVAMVLLLVAGGLILLLVGLCFNFFEGLPGVK